MKICLVSRCAWTLFNFRAGLARDLQRSGCEVICGGAGGDGYEERLADLGVRFVPLPVAKNSLNPLADLGLLAALLRWYRSERPDVVHHFTIKPVIYGSLAARMAGVPTIVNTITGLGHVFMEPRRTWLRRIVELQYRLALGGAQHTFFYNREDRDLFIERRLVRMPRTSILPGSGVDCRRFSPLESDADADGGPVTFLFVGRLLREKGVHEFVEAARTVRARHPAARFLLLGARDERNPTVVSQATVDGWHAAGDVVWIGERADVRPVMATADVVVLPSYREGLPRAILEASAMGKPVITTDAVGCREAVEDGVTGLMVPVKDAQALARAMIRLLEGPADRRRMGLAGRRKAEREFEEGAVIAAIKKFYRKECDR